MGGAVMSEITQEEALRLASTLVDEALKETEARCTVLALFISDCDGARVRNSDWSGAVSELRALQDYRGGLVRRQSLIQQALDCLTGEHPAKVPLPRSSARQAVQTQQQVQVRPRRRS
jgi:hypothetical protein